MERAAATPVLEWICSEGRGIAGRGEGKLQLLLPHSCGRNLFSSSPLHTASKLHSSLAETLSQYQGKHGKEHMVSCLLLHITANTNMYLGISPLKGNLKNLNQGPSSATIMSL